MLINLQNQLTQTPGIQQTYLAGTISAGGTQAPVKNIIGFNNQWAVQFGQTGEETAEIMNISGAPSGTAINFGTNAGNSGGTFKYAHSLDTPLYQIHYDQVILYRSTAGTGGPFSSFGTYNIAPDQLYTQVDDTTGANTYAYYAQYYNSVNGDLSGSSSIFVPGGPTYYSLQKIRSRVKDKLYSAGYIRDDSVITDWINEWYELMTNAAIKVNEDYLLGSQSISFGTNGLGTITDTTYKQLVKLECTWDGQVYIPTTEIALFDFAETDYFSLNAPRHAWKGETVFEILPHTQGGTAVAIYGQRFTPLVNDSDLVTQTLSAYTTSCTEYCLSVAYGLDQKDQDQQIHYAAYKEGKENFIAEITPRDLSSAKTISLTETVSGLEDDMANELGDWFW